MDTVRYGIIGIGNMGTLHIKNFMDGKVKNAEVSAVCDIIPEKLEWARGVCGDKVKYFDNYKDMLACDSCDVVVIATPHYLHPVIAIDAFNAGFNVLSEKPIGVYTKSIVEMMDVAKKSGKIFGIMYNQRTNPAYQEMRRIVQSGELGDIKRCVWLITDWYRTQAYYNSGGWRATWAGEGGGVLLNQCPHNLDLWQWIVGMPKRIRAFCAEGKYHDIEVEDDVTAYAEYENGSTGVFITTTGECPGTNRLEISGTKGKLVKEGNEVVFTRLVIDEREYNATTSEGFKKPDTVNIRYTFRDEGPQHVDIFQNYTDHILNGTPLLAPGYDGINGLSISNAMMLSSWKDKWVDVQNDGEEFFGELQKRIATSRAKESVAATAVANLEGTY